MTYSPPYDADISEYGQTIYADGTLPRTTKLHRCHCASWLWLPSDGDRIECYCGCAFAQRPVGVIVQMEDSCSSS